MPNVTSRILGLLVPWRSTWSGLPDGGGLGLAANAVAAGGGMAAAAPWITESLDRQISRDVALMDEQWEYLEAHVRVCPKYQDALPCLDCHRWMELKHILLRLWRD